jgi:hypothetical protein
MMNVSKARMRCLSITSMILIKNCRVVVDANHGYLLLMIFNSIFCQLEVWLVILLNLLRKLEMVRLRSICLNKA